MMSRIRLLCLLPLLIFSSCRPAPAPAQVNLVPGNPVAALSSGPESDLDAGYYLRATGAEPIIFPGDHGPHPAYQTEWWYYTGNLLTEQGRRFGYQLTFFRRALVPRVAAEPRTAEWAADQVYMAHFALTDTRRNMHTAYEKFSRAAAGLAGARADPFSVWLDSWEVTQIGPDTYRLFAGFGSTRLELELLDLKGPVLHGDQGYSQKGPQPGDASYYYSFTRLQTTGELKLATETFQVQGLSWMDHEYSTSALSKDQTGWDWFSIQLEDEREIMLFQIRRADGSRDPFSSGTLIRMDGATIKLAVTDFELIPSGEWRSPRTGAVYPARWDILIPRLEISLKVEPQVADQELDISYAYWEGVVLISGEQAGAPLSGSGYLEMTGYTPDL